MAVSGGTATADSDNKTWANGSAGNDYIYGGADDDTASGDAQARATGNAIADSFNEANGLSGAGNDTIEAYDGNNVVAGDAQAITAGAAAEASGYNGAAPGAEAGKDPILAGGGDRPLTGRTTAKAGTPAD